VPATEVVRLLRSVTCDLFPSARRKNTPVDEDQLDEGWAVSRLDLAVNFTGPVATVVEGYRMATTERVAYRPGRSYLFQSAEWEATTGYKIHIYSRDLKTRKRQGDRAPLFCETMKDSFIGPPPIENDPDNSPLAKGGSRIGRVEVQMRSPRALIYLKEQELVTKNRPKGFSLPVLLPRSSSESDERYTVWHMAIDYPRLHAFLRHEVLLLEPTIPQPFIHHARTNHSPKLQQILTAIAIAQNPGLIELFEGKTTKAAAKIKKEAAQWRRQIMCPSLLELAWPSCAHKARSRSPHMGKIGTAGRSSVKRPSPKAGA
jgi:hypothetical protein